MNDPEADIDAVLGLLTRGGHVAVVGISDKPQRASHEVTRYLLRQNFRVSLVNPSIQIIFDLRCFPNLRTIPGPVNVVNLFRRSSDAGVVVDGAIGIGARAVWFQEGVLDEAAATRARAAGLLVVMDRCILKEHARRTS